MRFVNFLSIVIVILCLASFYLGRRLLAFWPTANRHQTVLWLLLAVFVVLEILIPFSYRAFAHGSLSRITQGIGYFLLGLWTSAFLYVALSDIILGVAQFVNPRIAQFRAQAFFIMLALSIVSTLVGLAQALRVPRLHTVLVPVKNLARELEGFRIVSLTDLHIGPVFRRSRVEKLVGLANMANADVVALTGDFIDGAVDELAADLEPLRNLKARYGVFFVTGNHEYYWDAHAWAKVFSRFNATVLTNEHRVIRIGDAAVTLAGVTDYSSGSFYPDEKSDPRKAIAGAPERSAKILLAHQPASYKAAAAAGFDLQLSGHTHGGQFVPWNILVWLFQKYDRGLAQYVESQGHEMWIYTTSGAAFWGPPNRFLIPTEISIIELTRG